MKLSKEQWKILEPYFPKQRPPTSKGGRPGYPTKKILEGVLWVLRVGARWQDLPRGYPSGTTCYRHFKKWVDTGIFNKVIRTLVEDLRDRGKIDLTETFIDATFVESKKGVQKWAKPKLAKDLKSWQSLTVDLFLSPCLLKVLHHMRVDLLSQRFSQDILGTYLSDLSETKLTILMNSGKGLVMSMDVSLLLPTSEIERKRLKMGDLLDATDEDGWLRDSFHGCSPTEEWKHDMI